MTVYTDLQSIKVLADLKEDILKKIETITYVEKYKEGDYIIRENQYADNMYAIIEGKVALELSINSSSRCRIKDVFPTESFGISAIVDTGMRTYISDAIAVTDCKVFRWEGNRLERLLYDDYELGFVFMRNIAKIMKNRLKFTRAQLAEATYAK
jgi:CRP-like cAMP-binding protein